MTYITCCGRDRPIFCKLLIIGQHVVYIDFIGAAVVEPVTAITVHFHIIPCRCVCLAFVLVFCVVERYASLQVEAVDNVECSAECCRETVLCTLVAILVQQPIWVVVSRLLDCILLHGACKEYIAVVLHYHGTVARYVFPVNLAAVAIFVAR